jgi:hypothetical protein
MDAAAAIIIGGWLLVLGTLVTVGWGVYAVTQYPDPHDPRRNARHLVIPAAVGATVAIIGLALVVIGALATVADFLTT